MKFDPSDYLEKYGFEDGDVDSLTENAFTLRGLFLDALNRTFVQAGLPYEAKPHNVGCNHNQVRIGVEYRGEFYWGDEAQTLSGLKGAMEAAILQFREEIPRYRAWHKVQDSKLHRKS